MSDPPLSELLDSRADIPDLREKIKGMAADARSNGDDVTVEDYLALSRNNDTAYVQPSDLERAEWFADIYGQEGEPETHPRAFHYRIFAKDYQLRDGTEYRNTEKCWQELKKSAFWAQVLGLVDGEQIGDSKNTTVTPTAFDRHRDPQPPSESGIQFGDVRRHVTDSYRDARLALELEPAKVKADDANELIRRRVQRIVADAFGTVEYDETERQDYYIELWAEKSGVLSEDLAREYGATLRPAGGGEFSLQMVRDALDIAETREQDLVVVVVSDWDPKGLDMPKSCSRKIEIEAAFRDIEAFVHHAALTLEQVVEYELPGTPAKTPSGLDQRNPGAMAYEMQKQQFADYADDMDPVEVNAFQARDEAAYHDALRDVLDQYYDHDLGDRLERAVADAQSEAVERLFEAFDEYEDDIDAALSVLDDALDEYEKRLGDEFYEARRALERLRNEEQLVRQELKIREKREEVRESIRSVDEDDVLSSVELDVPSPETGGSEGALLDTRRGMCEQLERYKDFDVRY